MALETFQSIWSKIMLRCPLSGPALAQDWTRNAFRRLQERRTLGWSWSRKQGQFLFSALYNTGTITATFNNPTIAGVGTVFDASMVGRQFKVSSQTPIYTILSVASATSLTLTLDGVNSASWGGTTAAASGYQIYNAYQTVPSDFKHFISVVDPLRNWRLRLNVSAQEINSIDPQRSYLGPSYAVCSLTYDGALGAAAGTPPSARYEFWPHNQNQYVYPYLYISRPPDLDDSGATLPREVRGDLLLEMALAECARWPGPSEDKRNPYFDLRLAGMHEAAAERMIQELEVRDDDIYEEEVTYSTWQSMPFAIIPMLDSAYLQSHSI